MKRFLALCLVFGLAPAIVGSIASSRASDGSGGADSVVDGEGREAPIVVELFTSQGCSSCPPADRLLSELAAREDLEIIPLSFHVDYWNYIGWTDPFSSKAWSERQRRYARAFRSGRVYTPQMVIDGRWEGVGSDRAEISGLLRQARAAAPRIEISVSAALVAKDRLEMSVETHRFDPAVVPELLELWGAVVESDLVTPVARGENASKELRNDRVVRHLELLGRLGSDGAFESRSMELELPEAWARENLNVTALVQDPLTLRIYGAADKALPVRPGA